MSNIGDVAREAKVSIATVSRVVNGNYPVSDETRKKVECAIDKLNYKTNPIARGLVKKNMNVIAVMVPGISNMYFARVLEGIECYAKKTGYDVFIVNGIKSDSKEKETLEKLMEGFADGVIIADPKTQNLKNGFTMKMSKKIPIVLINGYSKGIDMNFIMSDEDKGTEIAMEYLHDLGHKSIAFIRGKESYSYDIKEHIYMKYAKRYGFEPFLIETEDGNTIDVVKNTENIIKNSYIADIISKKITAVFACNDLMAFGAINAMRDVRLSVPGDISVIGFDNISLSEMSNPSITTVDQHMYRLGESGAKRVIELIEGDTNVKKTVINTELIKRQSCKEVV